MSKASAILGVPEEQIERFHIDDYTGVRSFGLTIPALAAALHRHPARLHLSTKRAGSHNILLNPLNHVQSALSFHHEAWDLTRRPGHWCYPQPPARVPAQSQGLGSSVHACQLCPHYKLSLAAEGRHCVARVCSPLQASSSPILQLFPEAALVLEYRTL